MLLKLQVIVNFIVDVKTVVTQKEDASARFEQLQVGRQRIVFLIAIIGIVAERIQLIIQSALVDTPAGGFQPDISQVVRFGIVYRVRNLPHGVQFSGRLVQYQHLFVGDDNLYRFAVDIRIEGAEDSRIDAIGMPDVQIGKNFEQPVGV